MNSRLKMISEALDDCKKMSKKVQDAKNLKARLEEQQYFKPEICLSHEEREQACKDIFGWRDGFVQTEEFREVFSIEPIKGLKWFGNAGLAVFYGGWGHDGRNVNEFGCHSEIVLKKSGKLKYQLGYKWMPRDGFYLDAEIARLTDKYLIDFQSDILSCNIYKTIKSELEKITEIASDY